MAMFLNRKPVEVKIGAATQNSVPIYNEQINLWDVIDSSVFAKINEPTTFQQDLATSGSFFIKDIDVEEHLIFRRTGSFWSTLNNIQITGSLSVDLDGTEDTVSITVQGQEKLKVNEEGVLVFTALDSEPSAVQGGIYFSTNSELFLGT